MLTGLKPRRGENFLRFTYLYPELGYFILGFHKIHGYKISVGKASRCPLLKIRPFFSVDTCSHLENRTVGSPTSTCFEEKFKEMKTSNFKPSEFTCKKIVLLLMLFFYGLSGFSQKNQYLFTGFYNYQEGKNRSPMIGLVNESRNNFQSIQIGLVNKAHDGVNGGQIGLTNLNGASQYGSSIGLINYIDSKESGISIGLVNYANTYSIGTTIGLINTARHSSEGFHLGLTNISAQSSKGLRIGLVNQSNSHEGLMIGLVNKADSLNGKAIGFINLLKQDAFLAISANYHFDRWAEFQFKSGIKELYGIISYQTGLYNFINLHAIGYGIGTRFPVGQKFLISPELLYHSQISPYWKYKSNNNDKFSAYINFIIPVSNKLEIVFAKNIHYSQNNPYFYESAQEWSWREKPTKAWLSGHIGTTIRLQ
ncbi:MAG: hypothetical protein ACXIUQ_12725 [Cecembia sp.]